MLSKLGGLIDTDAMCCQLCSAVATGVYINAPDPYFLDGTHKDGMGCACSSSAAAQRLLLL